MKYVACHTGLRNKDVEGLQEGVAFVYLCVVLGGEEYYNRGLDKFSVKGVNDFNELNKLRREIEYVESLPSSKVAGVKNYERIIKPILDLEDVSESLPRDIFEIYGRMVDESAIYEMYKYQVLETITDLVVGGYTKKEIAENVRALYEHLTSKRGVDVENGFSFSRKVLPTK